MNNGVIRACQAVIRRKKIETSSHICSKKKIVVGNKDGKDNQQLRLEN